MGTKYQLQAGPFRASQISDGDPYELSNGHAIQCIPAGPDHAESNLTGGTALATDPDVEWAGVDVGHSPDEGNLRAADLGLGECRKIFYDYAPNRVGAWCAKKLCGNRINSRNFRRRHPGYRG